MSETKPPIDNSDWVNNVHFGDVDAPAPELPDADSDEDDDADPDDELLPETPQWIIDLLGFDPIELEDDDGTETELNDDTEE